MWIPTPMEPMVFIGERGERGRGIRRNSASTINEINMAIRAKNPANMALLIANIASRSPRAKAIFENKCIHYYFTECLSTRRCALCFVC